MLEVLGVSFPGSTSIPVSSSVQIAVDHSCVLYCLYTTGQFLVLIPAMHPTTFLQPSQDAPTTHKAY